LNTTAPAFCQEALGVNYNQFLESIHEQELNQVNATCAVETIPELVSATSKRRIQVLFDGRMKSILLKGKVAFDAASEPEKQYRIRGRSIPQKTDLTRNGFPG
jgi:hypothetical protein